VLEIRALSPPADVTDPHDFAVRGLANRGLDHTESFESNGLKAWTGVVHGEPSPFGQATNVRYIVIYYGNQMWIFKGASRAGTVTPSGDPFFLSTASTFRRMRASEFALAEPYRLHVVPRDPRARRWKSSPRKARSRSIRCSSCGCSNSLYPDGEPKPGDLVKDSSLGDCPLRQPHHPASRIPRRKRSQRLPTVTQPVLVSGWHLGSRDRRARDDEERVVPKTARAASFEADLAFPGRLRDDRRRIPGFTHEHHRTAIARAAASGRNARKLRKKFFVVRSPRRASGPA
jgi:hypothetical protein